MKFLEIKPNLCPHENAVAVEYRHCRDCGEMHAYELDTRVKMPNPNIAEDEG